MRRIILLLFVALVTLLPVSVMAGKRILYIGDSITDGGWGNSGGAMMASSERNHWDLNHIYGHSYMFLCATYYQATNPTAGFEFYNRGISGNTLEDIAKRWKSDVLALNPDVVSVLVGTNDIHYLLADTTKEEKTIDVELWGRRYAELLAELKRQNPDVVIVLGTPFVSKAGWVGEAEDYEIRKNLVDNLAVKVRELAVTYGAYLVDYNVMFDQLNAEAPKTDYWSWDGIHPTPAGHYKMAELWKETVGEL